MKTHGKRHTTEYTIWGCINTRCHNKNCKAFISYGGRGIKCEWKTFEEFYKDMGNRPSLNHSIDRIDNNKNYCKSNCRWATRKEQANNTRHQQKSIKVKGFSINQLSKITGFHRTSLYRRYKKDKLCGLVKSDYLSMTLES